MDATRAHGYSTFDVDRALCDGLVGVQIDQQTLMTTLVGVQLLAVGADKLHQWVSKRENTSEDVEILMRKIDEGNRRTSEAMSKIQTQMLTFQQDMIEVQTTLALSGRGSHRNAGV